MKKVTYRERTMLDKYRAIDREVTRNYSVCWVSGGLTYFKAGEFTVFCIATNDIISLG